MFLKELIDNLQSSGLPTKVGKEDLISFLNDGLISLHTLFNIRYEQALILVPQNRKIFKISSSDPNVIMASYAKLALCHLQAESITKEKQVEALVRLDKRLKSNTLLNDETSSKDIFDISRNEVLSIIDVEDSKDNNYAFNIENVFVLDPITLHFPNAKAGSVIYVKYKPKPKLIRLEDYDKDSVELDLPDTLKDCLIAFVTLKTATNVSGYEQFYPNVLNTYNNELAKARANAAVIPDPLIATLASKKGFV